MRVAGDVAGHVIKPTTIIEAGQHTTCQVLAECEHDWSQGDIIKME